MCNDLVTKKNGTVLNPIPKLLFFSFFFSQWQLFPFSGLQSALTATAEETTKQTQEEPSHRESQTPGSAQSRAEQWRQRRLEKSPRAEPYQRTGLEKALLWMENRGLRILLNPHFKGFYPQFGGLPTGSGFALGFRYWNPNLNDSIFDLQSSATLSFLAYQLYDLQLGELQQEKLGPFLYADLCYRNFPKERFFGIGPQTLPEDRTNYRFEDASYSAVLGYRFTRRFHLEVDAGFHQIKIGPGTDDRYPSIEERFDDGSAPGLAHQPDFFSTDFLSRR